MIDAKKKKRFAQRPKPRRYEKFFLIVTEGSKTEPDYFQMVKQVVLQNAALSNIGLDCIEGLDGPDPKNLLERMKGRLPRENLKSSDEAWIVLDRNHWSKDDLDKIAGWANTRENYGVAVSNPSFEYWLLLHFEAGDRVGTPKECRQRLKRHWPHYDKSIPPNKFDVPTIRQAIGRAKQRDQPPSGGWPERPGVTTVYRLVERMLTA